MIIMFTRRSKATIAASIRIAFDGEEKKRSETRSIPTVRVVYENSSKPEPRDCIIGGETKVETNNSTHHTNVTASNRTVKLRRQRTAQRLYGETCRNLATFQSFGFVENIQLDHPDLNSHCA
jgi:hypothetical protein